ncbi:nucleotidyl transferase AbiEii/AbiGii toxin family protein [Pseudactinotalea sp. HY158]|uniref:nucleotidyl transferase AbiEii/AbiGii toxin family protein n=1 Tax=Pseudactinotalea sp. HY158 TaxID=2654547 RepID=UPI00129C407E|nr:nucleotidyl transferase AbiEii/AbiGii toxin family protein [Pseudactinotalea sp. HY158]QGH70227.1 nucleotidyl transferase AbiEii/AbiGii toxin family protein [Pseudactinotalea sp. HY158]
MADTAAYSTAAGVESAIKNAAKTAAAADPSLDVGKRIQLEYFNRFLSRVFSEGEGSDWVLKGGTGILARIPSTRSTRDIDLYRRGYSLDRALEDLRRLSRIDLHDHFTFEYAGHSDSIGTDTQPYTDGYRVKFNVFIGISNRGTVHVDLAVGAGITDQITASRPVSALPLPRLTSHAYRLYPVVDQIADKVCATMTRYGERDSTREKDLVDLVAFATTHDIDGGALRTAILTEAQRRRMMPFDHFTIPAGWGPGYARLSRPVPHCAAYSTAALAAALIVTLIDPALSGTAIGRTWMHHVLDWTRSAPAPSGSMECAGSA